MDLYDIAIAKKLSGSGGGGGGSSDFSTAKVTIPSNEEPTQAYYQLIAIIDDELQDVAPYKMDDDNVIDVVLYKGQFKAYPYEDVVISGDAVYDSDDSSLTITGDCVLRGYMEM